MSTLLPTLPLAASPLLNPVIICLLLLFPPPGSAQIYGDYLSYDRDSQHPVNIYFGAARDDAGDYVRGATIVVATPYIDYVAVTDARGRFRLELPTDVLPRDIAARCSHMDYAEAAVRRRLPRGDALTPVELTCRLQ